MPAGDLVKSSAQLPDLSDPFRPVHGSAPLTPYDVERIERVIRHAGKQSGLEFSVFIGSAAEDARAYATRLHRSLDDPDRSVLILVDPPGGLLEIVTGARARRVLGDAECQLAAATMQSSFVAHDLAGGLTAGIQQLGTAAYQAPTLHLEQNG